jgi:4-hydroxyacetophenone monooxygenase
VRHSFVDGDFDPEQARSALEEANLPTLIAVLYQLTGDESWLKEPFLPRRNRGLEDNDDGGFASEVQATIREAALVAVIRSHDGIAPAVPEPTPEMLRRVLSNAMGEQIPAAYEPLIVAEMRDPIPRDSHLDGAVDADFAVVIIGAGVSGLIAATKLRQAGINFVVLEKDKDIGGTWHENTYPGAGVDTPSYLYSLSFYQRRWSSHFAKQPEVHAYLRDIAERFDLLSAIEFEVEVTAATYDEVTQRWVVTAERADGRTLEIESNALVTGVGFLNRPKLPDLEGLSRFQGPAFHSSDWPDGLDVRGKRVAVIGTGASAMQIVPTIADQASELHVYQRTPQWIAPAANYLRTVSPAVHWLMDHVPYYYKWYRMRLAWTFNDKLVSSLSIDPEWRHPDRSINEINEGHRQYLTRYLTSQLEGRPDLREKAVPNYPPFGKRMLLDNRWFETLRRPNVNLITEPVQRLTETGVECATGEHREADVVVLATGFKAQQYLFPMTIIGRHGVSLQDRWNDDDARAYLGITVPDFPNLFIMYGPNTNAPGGSYFFIAECQVHYIMQLIARLAAGAAGTIECKHEVFEDYNQRVDAAHSRMIWSHRGMDTYYRNSKGRVVTQFPWRVLDYWLLTRHANLEDFLLEPCPQLS